jgi:Na+-transporting methylmalonyl-CoA/oxaloacetate decarboxylase gamma subunit
MPAVWVSLLAISVIFVVLSILIGVIKLLDYLIPYQAPPASPSSGGSIEEEHIAALHAALAQHLGKHPHEIQILNVKPL